MNRFTMMLAIAAMGGTAVAQNARRLPDGQANTTNRGQIRSQDAPRQGQRTQVSKRGQSRQEMLKRFDTDGDGKLSDAERAAGRATHEQRRTEGKQKILERYDTNRDGQLSDAERQSFRGQPGQDRAPRGQRQRGQRGQDGNIQRRRGQPGQFGDQQRPSREQILRRFDADGDGQLSDSERQAAREQLSQRRDKRGNRARRDGFQGEQPRQGQRSDRRAPPQEIVDRFDADGDGRLNEPEHRAAREAFETRRTRTLERFDANGNGRLDGSEHRLAREAFQNERRIRRLDSDRDGSLNETELGNAFELLRSGDPQADFNADGVVDIRDVEMLIEKASDK